MGHRYTWITTRTGHSARRQISARSLIRTVELSSPRSRHTCRRDHMTEQMARRSSGVKPLIALGVAMMVAGCGSSRRNPTTHRNREVHEVATYELPFLGARPFIGERFVCGRTERGDQWVLVVGDKASVGRAKSYLALHHRRGRVEIRTPQQYFNREYVLWENIRHSTPPHFRSEFIHWTYPTESGPCPVVRIELGFRGHVPPDVVRWSRHLEYRYGRDRVAAEYVEPHEAL